MSDECDESSRIAVLEALLPTRIQEVTERMDLKFEATERALAIQTGEIARRLDGLNGEAERLRSMQATYIPREVFERQRIDTDKSIIQLQMFQSNIIGRMAAGAGIGAIIGGIVTALVIKWLLP